MKKYGVISEGIVLPLIRKGDNLIDTIISSLDLDTLSDNDVLGITESVVARAQGNYVSIDEAAEEIKRIMGNPADIVVANCIYSRNRFAMILKAIARAAENSVLVYMPKYDEVGNIVANHPFTKVNYIDYYRGIILAEGKKALVFPCEHYRNAQNKNTIYCGLHDSDEIKRKFPNLFTLKDFFADKCEYGLLGCNKANDELIKLFPKKEESWQLCKDIQNKLYELTHKHIIICIYGDGCFKDPVGGIWEFADPVTMPAYTDKELLESSPNEIKLKAAIDEGHSDEEVYSIIANKDKDLKGNMVAQGTTPRRYKDLLASLMDLTSGSGDRGTPVILVKNYFNNNI